MSSRLVWEKLVKFFLQAHILKHPARDCQVQGLGCGKHPSSLDAKVLAPS